MKKFFAECLEVIDFLMEEFTRHNRITTAIMAGWIIMTIVLNTVYMGKPVPVTGMILKTWMAYVNVVCAGTVGGFTIGYVNKRASKN